MNFDQLKRIIESSKDSYSELQDFHFKFSRNVTDVCYLQVVDNMLSSQFLQFLIDSEFEFAIFPSSSDSYSFDIQICFDV